MTDYGIGRAIISEPPPTGHRNQPGYGGEWRNSFPENNIGAQIVDNLGCAVNPIHLGCLTCPLPRCVYENGELKRRQRLETEVQNNIIFALKKSGKSAKEIAHKFSMSTRAIHYRLKQYATSHPV